MLKELRVRSYAVIDEVRLEPGPGLTVLSGETGAGKSLIVDALSLLLGERASSEAVRAGEERALIEGTFDVDGLPAVRARCAEAGLETDEGWLILRRELQREGRNRAWVNGSPATAGLIGELGSALVDLHGQHEHQALLRRAAQRRVLDAFAGASETAADVADAFRSVRELESEVEEVRRRAAEVRERADYLRFKAEEIEGAGLDPGEEERLETEARRLEHSEELLELSSGLHEAVYAGEESLVDRLGELRRPLGELSRIDPAAGEFRELADTARHALEELGRRVGEYRETVEHDPGRLRRVRERLDRIFRLKGKYGGTIEEVLAAGRAARAELEAMEGSELEVRRLEAAREEASARLAELAGVLGEARRRAAGRLEEEMGRLLPELGMEGGRFEVALEPLDEPASFGAENVEFRVSLNPGFPPGPLARVASGGEMSRLMLALKTVLAAVDDVPSLVFDEIDAGVGGQVAHRLAGRLAEVAERHQVFVITHLPQIAARADAHYRVEKSEEGGRAAARVRRLEGEDRVLELARMLGGDPESEVSRQHARELLSGASGPARGAGGREGAGVEAARAGKP